MSAPGADQVAHRRPGLAIRRSGAGRALRVPTRARARRPSTGRSPGRPPRRAPGRWSVASPSVEVRLPFACGAAYRQRYTGTPLAQQDRFDCLNTVRRAGHRGLANIEYWPPPGVAFRQGIRAMAVEDTRSRRPGGSAALRVTPSQEAAPESSTSSTSMSRSSSLAEYLSRTSAPALSESPMASSESSSTTSPARPDSASSCS